jgi:cytochrome bd-type quinol oxidase subunit 2
MGNNYFIIAVVVIAAVFLLSRMLTLRAMKHLAQGQKAALVDLSRRLSRFQLLVLMALVVGMMASVRYARAYSSIVILIYFGLLVIFIVARSLYIFSRLRKQGFPKEYLNAMILSMALQAAAIIIFAYVMFTMVGMPAA